MIATELTNPFYNEISEILKVSGGKHRFLLCLHRALSLIGKH